MSTQREWKPGDVAWARYTDSSGGEIALRTQTGWMGTRGGMPEGTMEAYDLRPLVVIDPEDREQVERLYASWLDNLAAPEREAQVNAMQAALRSLFDPPKPDEPKGLGAVVEDETGIRWVRAAQAGDPWRPTSGPANWREYGLIKAVRVLSEGVTDAD